MWNWDGKINGNAVQAGSVFVWIAAGTDYNGNLVKEKEVLFY